MNKKNIIYILLLLPILMGCDKRLFKFQSNIDLAKLYTFDKTGPTQESATITEEQIRSALDLPSDAKVTKVNIETLSLRIKLNDGNEATLLRIKGFINDASSNTKIWDVDQISPPIISPDASIFGQKIGINGLIETGINKLKSKIEGFIKRNDFGSFVINVEVDSSPFSGRRIAMDIEIVIQATIEYEQCVEVWDGLDAGEECPN
ncbi:hypothetical protein BMS3Abin04_03012 [bacterium BMS3Abin04]|nr:hypothetical protein BMS3Abin04_03012 [bacterium BMS3Abin04]